jgi:uncharacterized protein
MGWADGATTRVHPATEPDVAARMAEAYDAAERGDYPAALAIWGPLAQSGIARAQNNVGACFAEGLGIDRDPALALRWLTLAAEAGDPVGRRNLAALYFKGEGVAQDHARATELYRAAAEVGDAPAQDMLSWMLLEGEAAPSPGHAWRGASPRRRRAARRRRRARLVAARERRRQRARRAVSEQCPRRTNAR